MCKKVCIILLLILIYAPNHAGIVCSHETPIQPIEDPPIPHDFVEQLNAQLRLLSEGELKNIHQQAEREHNHARKGEFSKLMKTQAVKRCIELEAVRRFQENKEEGKTNI